MMQVMVLATLAAWVQEDAESKRIGSLIERLGSDSVVERDEAAEALESIGPRALPSLRKALEGSPAELRARAEAAIRAIERNRKIDDLKAGGKPVTVRAKDVAAAELARTLGVQADASLGDRRMSLEVEGATLLESLDILCAATPNLTYGRDDAGALVLKAGRHPAHPAAYAGPFRLRILRLEARRVQTYLEHKILLRLRLGADHDPSVRPLPNPAIEILEAVDDRGAAVTLAKPSAREAAQAADGAGADGAVFTSTDLAPEATRLARLRAVVRPVFVLGSQDVVFPSPARGDVRELGSYRATITGLSTDSAAATTTLQLTFTAEGVRPDALRRAVEDRFERSAVLLVDAGGEEIVGQPTVPRDRIFHHDEAPPQAVDYHFTFPKRLPRAERKALKLRFHTDTWEHELHVELKDVKLP